MATLSGKYIGIIFPIAFTHFMSLSHFDNSCNISNHFIIITCIILICDQWFLMFLPYKCSDDQHSFSNKVLEIKVYTFFIYNAIAHHQTTIQGKHNFYLHRERKNSYYLLYFVFTLLRWSGAKSKILSEKHSKTGFEACLYTEHMGHMYTHYDLPVGREWPICII